MPPLAGGEEASTGFERHRAFVADRAADPRFFGVFNRSLGERFRPFVEHRVGAAQAARDQVVELVLAMLVVRDAVALEYLLRLLEINGSVGLVEPRRGAEGAGRRPVVRDDDAGC